MDIDDILEEKFNVDFKKLDKFLTKEMKESAGNPLVRKMKDVFGEKRAKQWYFSRITSLENKRPYDYCRKDPKKGNNKI